MVIDNSLSMVETQKKFAAKFQNALSALKYVDWQVGVTTTDLGVGGLPHWSLVGLQGSLSQITGNSANTIIKSTDSLASPEFLNTILRQETLDCANDPQNPCPSPWTQPIGASVLAIQKRNAENAGFFRNGADLAVVIVSDTDEMSNGRSFNPTPAETLVTTFKQTWPSGKTLRGYGVIIQPGDGQCLAQMKKDWPLDAVPATFAQHLADITGGATSSICSNDYSQVLSNISNDIYHPLNSITLAHTPLAGSLSLAMSPAQSNIPYSLIGKVITFSTPPMPGTQITARYKY
jgi:hypothetical protein